MIIIVVAVFVIVIVIVIVARYCCYCCFCYDYFCCCYCCCFVNVIIVAAAAVVVVVVLGALGAPDEKYGNPNFQRGISEDRKPWINPAVSDGASMMEVMKTFKPTCLLGLSTVSGIFDEVLIRQMASQCDKPIILPMSNPTSKAECTAEQAYEWTDGELFDWTANYYTNYLTSYHPYGLSS